MMCSARWRGASLAQDTRTNAFIVHLRPISNNTRYLHEDNIILCYLYVIISVYRGSNRSTSAIFKSVFTVLWQFKINTQAAKTVRLWKPPPVWVHFYINFICRTNIEKTAERSKMKIENDADPYMWFADCLGPEPQDWMKDVGLDWFDEELLGRPESPEPSAPVPRPAALENSDDHPRYRGGYPSYTIESSAWLIQQHQRSADSGDDNDEDDSLPPPVLPPMIPGTRSFSDQLHRIRKPYALGSPPSTSASGLLVRYFQYRINI